ncbi:MAG TPA: alkaline phosphatase family protein [Thermoanaerobaculia bacterium]|jgi:hypothetical protein
MTKSLACALAMAAVLSAAAQQPQLPPQQAPPSLSAVRRVFVVVLENEDERAAIRQGFLGQLASRGALLKNYHAITHPSQPNYVALVAGDTLGVRSDRLVTLNATHLGDLLDARKISWKAYAEDYPGGCYLGASRGNYARKHVPFLDFVDVQSDPRRCAEHVVDARELDADIAHRDLPQFSFYVPNLQHDGHDTNVRVADAWLRTRFETLMTDPRFIDGTLFVVVFDEARLFGPNIVYCVLVGAGIHPGVVSQTRYDDYDLLRTFEEIFHAGTLGRHDATASIIRGIWLQ